MKRLVVCCDGTWNELDYAARPVTNVVKIAQSVLPTDKTGTEQVVFYDEGVGTLEGEGMTGGGFGNGLEQNILDAYMFLVFNYSPGDEIYIFGFSRGAFTARSLVGLIRNCGIIRRDAAGFAGDAMRLYKDPQIKANDAYSSRFRLKYGHKSSWISPDTDEEAARAQDHPDHAIRISYLGIWDTVGQNGVPGVWNALFNLPPNAGFHDLTLSKIVERARHAVAIDERRKVFRPTLWAQESLAWLRDKASQDPKRAHDPDAYMQRWFPGDHGSVGGGGDVTGLSDLTLQWVCEGATRCGVKLAYDPKFKGVKYPSYIPSKADRHYWVKSKKTIRFKPSLDCPLTNISGQWDNPNRSMVSRLLGAVAAPVTDVVMSDAVGVATLERLSELACLSELSDEARQYVFDSGYKSALIARLARENSRFSRSEIETALAG